MNHQNHTGQSFCSGQGVLSSGLVGSWLLLLSGINPLEYLP
jgi:hypothetical protein